MQRFKEIPLEEMTPAQREAAQSAASGLRGLVPAPMKPWLVSPHFAQMAAQLGEFLRYRTTLEPRLSELAILVTARFWTSQFEWFIHARIGLEAGLSHAVVDAIANKQTPEFTDAAERVVYEVASAIHHKHGLDDAQFVAARETLGAQGLAELIGVLGYYTLVSMTLNVYDINQPGDKPKPLRD